MAGLDFYELFSIICGLASLASWIFGGLTAKEHKIKWVVVTLICVLPFLVLGYYSIFIAKPTSLIVKWSIGALLVLTIVAVIQIVFFRFDMFPQPFFIRLKEFGVATIVASNLTFLLSLLSLLIVANLLTYKAVMLVSSTDLLHKIIPFIGPSIIVALLTMLLYGQKKFYQRFEEQFTNYNIEAARLLNSALSEQAQLQSLTQALQKCIINWLENGRNDKNMVTCWVFVPDYHRQQFDIAACFTGNDCSKWINPENMRAQSCHPSFYGVPHSQAGQNGMAPADYGSALAHFFFEPYSFRRDRPIHGQGVFLTQVSDREGGLDGLIADHVPGPNAIRYSTATAWISNVFVDLLPSHLQNQLPDEFDARIPMATVLVTSSRYKFGFRDRGASYLMALHAKNIGIVKARQSASTTARYLQHIHYSGHHLRLFDNQPQNGKIRRKCAQLVPRKNSLSHTIKPDAIEKTKALDECLGDLYTGSQWICSVGQGNHFRAFEVYVRNKQSKKAAKSIIKDAGDKHIEVELDELAIVDGLCKLLELRSMDHVPPNRIHTNVSLNSLTDLQFQKNLSNCPLLQAMSQHDVELAFEIPLVDNERKYQNVKEAVDNLKDRFKFQVGLDVAGVPTLRQLERVFDHWSPDFIKVSPIFYGKIVNSRGIKALFEEHGVDIFLKKMEARDRQAIQAGLNTLKGIQGRTLKPETSEIRELARQLSEVDPFLK